MGFRFYIGFVEVAGVKQKLYGILQALEKNFTHPIKPSKGDSIIYFIARDGLKFRNETGSVQQS